MNQKQAEYFLEIVNLGSLTKAAQKLYVSQPSLSQTIKNLEAELGFSLFESGSKPLRLTPVGESMVEVCRNVITFNRRIEDQIAFLRNAPARPVRIGVLPGQTRGILEYFVHHREGTDYFSKISVTEAGSVNIEKQLLLDQLDLGIIDGRPVNSALHYIPLKEDTLVLITNRNSAFSKQYPNNSLIEISELRYLNFFTKPQGNHSRLILDSLSQIYGVPIHITYEVENLEDIFPLFPELDCAMLLPLSFYERMSFLHQSTNQYFLNMEGARYQEWLCYRKDLFLTDGIRQAMGDIQKLISSAGYI